MTDGISDAYDTRVRCSACGVKVFLSKTIEHLHPYRRKS